jgi:microcystin-dependent protein
MRLEYATPDTIPAETICRTLFIPNERKIIGAVTGALNTLLDPENWEQLGTKTPDEMVAGLQDMVDNFSLDGECEVIPLTLPVGLIMPFAGDTLPDGMLACDGAQYTQAAYPALYDALDPVFVNTGNQTFVVPDLRGRTVIGVGQGSGLSSRAINSSGGEENHVLTILEIPKHSHNFALGNDLATAGAMPMRSSGLAAFTGQTLDTGGSNVPHNNMQPFRALNYVIVAE